MASSDVDFDEEGRKLISTLNFAPERSSRFADVNAIWCHPETRAKVYCGNISFAKNLEALMENQITHVVNCQEKNSTNFFENEAGITYMRFCVSSWFAAPNMKTDQGVVDYFKPMFHFVMGALEKGESVLIHCLAGAHRAGTTSVAFLMLVTEMSYRDALDTARRCRSIINPISHLGDLLVALELAQKKVKLA